MRRFLSFIFVICFAFAANAAFAQEQTPEQKKPPQIAARDILAYLEQVTGWQRQVQNLSADGARQAFLNDELAARSAKIVQSGFDYARAQAATVQDEPEAKDEKNASEEDARRARMRKAADDLDTQVRELNQRLGQVADKLRQSPDAELSAERERILGKLKLARAQQGLIGTMIAMNNSADGKENLTLAQRINRLERAAKENDLGPPAAGKEKASVRDSDGMFRRISQLLSLSQRKQAVDDALDATHALRERNRELTAILRLRLREAIEQGNALSAQQGGEDAGAYRESLDAVLARYKQIGDALIPLRQMGISLDAAERHLNEWNALHAGEWSVLFRRLSFHLALLAVAILIPWMFSELARRAIIRYAQDPRRRRQLQITRRVIFVFVLAVVILVNFVTEFGSVATFAGFITAGLAVALQTVLVSLVAHFFFFGRFGVRAGDRVTVSGVTGDVVQVGILRLYLRELNKDQDLKPTGKIVAFPNSILFQPSAFYKHMES